MKAIRESLGWHADFVHFLCHGAKKERGTVLYLEDENGNVETVEASTLVQAVSAPYTPPVLVFLAACETAERSAKDGFMSLGPKLVEQGAVKAAVAMSEQIGMTRAAEFAHHFYAHLFEHGAVDLGVNQARESVRDSWDWSVPILFSQLADNQLIDFPLGRIHTDYLSHTGDAGITAAKALAAARQLNKDPQLVADLNDVIDELRKSHKVLADLADPFRALGRNPQNFRKKFERFSRKFKKYYDHKVWKSEKTSCGKIGQLADKLKADRWHRSLMSPHVRDS